MPLRTSPSLGGRASPRTHATVSAAADTARLTSSSLTSSPMMSATTPATAAAAPRRLRHPFLLAAAIFACIAVIPVVPHFTYATATASVITCPYGWSLYEAAVDTPTDSGSAAPTRQCVRVIATADVPASAAESTCADIFATPPLSADGVTPWPFTRHVAPHGVAVRSAAENAFVRNLFLAAAEEGLDDDAVLLLGGVAGYGLVEWYADTPAAAAPVSMLRRVSYQERLELLADSGAAENAAAAGTYTNFADDGSWQLHAGAIAMRLSGQWELLPTDSATLSTAYPFACAFAASGSVTLPDSGDSSSATVAPTASSSSAADSSSASGTPQPTYLRAHRPAVPQPAPACLEGWTALPSSVDMSEGIDNTVCYRLFANASEVGGRMGKAFADARDTCSGVHPKATLASVMSAQENAWVVSALLSRLPSSGDCDCGKESSSSTSSKSARTVFLGGSYTRDGTGAGLLGSWYADPFLFNASEYAATDPSSPAWPTARNRYFSNWGSGEPLLSYGVVGITPPLAAGCSCANETARSTAGLWVGVDPRSTQPFLCSYVNDGSTFPPSPTSTTPAPDSSTAPPTPGPSTLCIPGWSYLELTNSCYRVYPATTTTTAASTTTTTTTTNVVTAATMEEECESVLRGRVVPAKVGKVRAVSMLTTAESNYVGALLQSYLDDPSNTVNSSSSSSATTPVSLAGISFIDGGDGGFYISGVRELDPELALELWAAAEPSAVKGCVAVDVSGLWHYVPCSTYTSESMPDNAAVRVEAFTCQYSAKDIDPVKDVLAPPTTTPEPTSGPGWSSDSDSSSGSDGWLPLNERIAALSGATHLVVAAGSTGIYTLQGPTGVTASAASVRGLHLFFAPLSAFYAHAAPTTAVDGTAIRNVLAGAATAPASLEDIFVLSPNASTGRPFAPCEGYKDQSRLTRVRRSTVTVHHSNTSEVGYVCVSQDGVHYVPTAMTYEVTEVTVQGFIASPSRTAAAVGGTSAARPTWLPPLFCNGSSLTDATALAASASAPVCGVRSILAIPEHGTGTVQLALRTTTTSSSSSTAQDEVAVVTAQSPMLDTMVSHLRLSSTADCMGADVPFYFLANEIVLQRAASARYTRRTTDAAVAGAAGDASLYSIFGYQYATVRAARFSALRPLFNASANATALSTLQPPAEYFVCVSVEKSAVGPNSSAALAHSGAASRRLMALWNVSGSNSSSSSSVVDAAVAAGSRVWSSASSSSTALANEAFLLSITDRLAARTSLSRTGAAVRTYTVVPGLKAHVVPAPLAVKGMWALPPRRLARRPAASSSDSDSVDVATLVPTPATFNRSAHYLLKPTYTYTYNAPPGTQSGSGAADAVASVSHLHIPQYSSPIVLLDGHDVQPGMLALLSSDPNRCNRLQPLPRNDPTAAAATWPDYLDTMVPLSTVSMRVASNSSEVVKMAYMQLNMNHTGLWGHHPTRTDDAAATEQTWYVCVAHSPLSPFMPLRAPALKITVHRLRVGRFAMDASAAFTSSDAVAAAEAADASTTHLNLNTGFAGMLWMHGVDVRLWSTTTLHSAQVAFAVVMPSGGTPDETATQCAHPNLFYSQQGLGLLTQDSRRGRGGNASREVGDDDVDTNVGMVIPLGFFTRQSTRRMQVCLSVPLSFAPVTATSASAVEGTAAVVPQRRLFAPLVNTTLDVRPPQVLYMGRYSAIPSSPSGGGVSGTVIRLAEGARDVVLPVTGYGIRPDMTLFLSRQLCHGASSTPPAGGALPDVTPLVASQSLLNISVVSLYDLPSSYWNLAQEDAGSSSSSGHAHRPRVFVVLRRDDLLRKAAAQSLFQQNATIDPFTGVVTATRVPLNVCLYAPGTATLVFPTDFQLVVDPPRVTSVRNLPSDAALIARAAAQLPDTERTGVVASAATVVYASNMDLVVEGFGLDDVNTWLMPAVDCSNASSFLWRAPVKLSALPSSSTTSLRIERDAADKSESNALYADSSRYVDPQTSYSSWFATLQAQETVRVGADTLVSSGQFVRRFQWCVRIVEDDEEDALSDSAWAATTSGYVTTRIPYQLLIPAASGFSLENARRGAPPSTVLALPTQHPTKGRWFSMQLVGPIVDVVDAIGSPLYLFLAPENYTCHEVKNAYLGQGLYTFGNASFSAVNGSAVLLPRWLATAGYYRLCASAVYPTLASAEEGVEAALQFFNLDGLRVHLIQAVYGVFALNHTTTVTVEQGQEWTLPISGSMLTNRSVVRLQTAADKCGEPMRATRSAGGGVLPDIPIQNDFTGFYLFGQDDESSELEGGTSVLMNGFYIVLSQSLIRSLAAPASYVLCLQPQRSLAWRAAPAITLKVVKHVRRPTHYNYFPVDGSEDVAALTALAPTKVALEWNTGEENMVNIVGAAGQQVSLALWCLPKPNASSVHNMSSSSSSSGSSDAIGVEEELVPCGDHRRVMFVKPLDNDEDPCFVDAEAVDEDILRGPFVLDFGVLTLPHALSVVESDSSATAPLIIPNMTQPWIMCIETGPERWREPNYPMLQLQYTRPIPTGFRLGADDASNTTAPFPAHKTSVEATTSAAVDEATGMPLGGNTTLVLYAQDSSKVVYVNGYGIERGHLLRFGRLCEEEMAEPYTDSSSSSSSSGSSSGSGNATAAALMQEYLARVSERQQLANPRLYATPLLIEDSNGVFLIPSTHLLESEDAQSGQQGTPVCFSADGGATFKKTALFLRVLPSRLQTDTETAYRNLLAQILSNTLLVPQRSRGSVDLSALVKVAKGTKEKTNASSDSTITTADSAASGLSYDDDDDSRTANTTTPPVYVRVGTQVLLSASCSVNTHGLPLLTVNVPNVITLTKHHTAAATAQRLLLCFRNADAAASAAAAQTSDAAEGTENEVGAVTAAFQWYGLYYRVLGVQVEQVALHSWTPTAAMSAENVNHVVLRRGADDDLLLPVQMQTTATPATIDIAANSSLAQSGMSAEDELLQRIEQNPTALSLLSLTRLYVGRPCYRAISAPEPIAAISPFIASYAGVHVSFTANSVDVSPLAVDQRVAATTAASLNGTLVAALPSGGGLAVPQFPLAARGSVCFSVDGGQHYLAVGIAHFTEDWAPTLRVTLDTEDEENNEDVAEVDDGEDGSSAALRAITTAMRVYAQSSTTRQLMDTRFVDPRGVVPVMTTVRGTTSSSSGSTSGTGGGASSSNSSIMQQVLDDLGQLTTAMLWSGFVGADGFAMDGLLYLPASSKATQTGTQQPQSLYFSLDNRLQNVPTNLTLTVLPWFLTCFGTTAQQDVFVRQQDVGLYASTAPGICSAGVRDGARVRVVPLSAASCADPAVVDSVYVMDLPTVQPGSWGALSTPSSSSSSAASPFRALQYPMALRYVPEGTYALCLRQDLPFVSGLEEDAQQQQQQQLYTAVYAATPLRLHVSYNWTIVSISGATINTDNDATAAAPSSAADAVSSVVALTQGSNAELVVTGTAVDVHGVPLLLALAPRTPRSVTRRRAPADTGSASNASSETWMWANGCAGVADTWDPQTGSSLLVHNGSTLSGRLLSAPWDNAQGGVWRLDAAYLREVEWAAGAAALMRYTVCYSVDGGLTFHPAGITQGSLLSDADASTTTTTTATAAAAAPFTAVVVPPAITSLSASRAAAPGVEATAQELQWSADAATAPSVRVQHLFSSAAADAEITTTPRVTSYTRVDGAEAPAYATRPSRLEYAWTSAFVGNGVGPSSGRHLPPSSSSSSPPKVSGVVADVPTVAAAVALVRTRAFGATCDGLSAASTAFLTSDGSGNWDNTSTAPLLAAPIFLLNLQHGGVWSAADRAAIDAWRTAQTSPERLTAFDEMNPVLSQPAWVAETAAMWADNTAAPLNGHLLTGRATTDAMAAARSDGESLLVCLSTDGTHFYSADVARAAFAERASMVPQQAVTIAATTTASATAAQLSPWPLYLRAAAAATTSSSGNETVVTPAPLWMRETAMVMELLARPAQNTTANNAVPPLSIGAASLLRFQAALAAQLGIDPAVVVVQLAASGTVVPPQSTATPSSALHNTAAVADDDMESQVLLSAVAAVQARHHAMRHPSSAATTTTATATAQSSALRTYALVVSIAADAVAYNATAQASTLTASPDLLYRCVSALRGNVSGPTLLAALVPPAEAKTTALYSLTVNFTMSNGADLHAAVAEMTSALPTSPAQEVAWRTLFLAVPYATLAPDTVPDAEDNDTTSKVSWWVIPVLLILPALMVYGTYYVYKKYLKKAPDAVPATEVTVESTR